jgi:hypothetical protein
MLAAEANAAGLKAVFGAQDAVAKARYAKARSALSDVAADLGKHVTTDYNRDDQETEVTGLARYSTQSLHLQANVVEGVNPAENKATLVHEALHLADSSVVDLGYYKTPAFEAMSEEDKINNAAHYEELPRRSLGISDFPDHTFLPSVLVGGAVMTRLDVVRKVARDRLQYAWEAAAAAHRWLRRIHEAGLANDTLPFTTNKPLILELSQLTDMTIHHQADEHARVTLLDITIIESIARAMWILTLGVDTQKKVPDDSMSDQEAADEMIAVASANYGLLRDEEREKLLVDWLAAHVHTFPAAQ